jgi:hypothetical protein
VTSTARPALVLALLGTGSIACGHAVRPPAMPSTAADDVPGPDAVHVDMYPRDDERWTLRRADDSYVCTLPCSYWARPESGLVIRLEGTTPAALPTLPDDDTSFAVPAHLPANPNERLALTVDRRHGLGTLGKIIAGPLAVTFGLMGLAFTALSTASLATGSKNTTATASGCASVKDPNGAASASGCETTTTHGVAADVGGLAFGIGALTVAVLSTIWFLHDREGGLRYEAPAATTPTSASPTSAVRVHLGPSGLSGTF